MKLDEKTIEKIKDYFAEKPEVLAVYLYGSFAKGTAREDSDVDLGVLVELTDKQDFLDIPQITFTQDLTELVDKEIEVQDLSVCSLEFAHRVLSEGKLIFCRNHEKRINFEMIIITKYFDLKPVLGEYYKNLSKIAKKGELGVRFT